MNTTPGRSPTSDLLCVTAGCKRPVTEGSAYLCAECAARIASGGSGPTSEAKCSCPHVTTPFADHGIVRNQKCAVHGTGRLPASEPPTCSVFWAVRNVHNGVPSYLSDTDNGWTWARTAKKANLYATKEQADSRIKMFKDGGSPYEYDAVRVTIPDCTPPSARSDQGGERVSAYIRWIEALSRSSGKEGKT